MSIEGDHEPGGIDFIPLPNYIASNYLDWFDKVMGWKFEADTGITNLPFDEWLEKESQHN